MNNKKNYYPPMHTAEHILNKTMTKMFGCQRSENCHIERKKSKCDFILTQEPTKQQITKIENQVNKIINENLTITHKVISYDQAKQKYNLKVNKEKKPQIRITSIGNYDHCPCIGEHVANTAEIGTFKITTTSYEKNTFRLRFKLITQNKTN